ncbi:MAG: hypothetical protein KC503_26585 [Myxococcales bacterium]|nr:hypothetical protein [Myxococcales bacterium]
MRSEVRVRVEARAGGDQGTRVHVSVRAAAHAAAREGELTVPSQADEAARAVALFVAEVARPALDITLPDEPAAPRLRRRAPAPRVMTSARLRLALLGNVGSGFGGGRLRAGARLEATLRIAGPLRLYGAGGFDIVPAAQQDEVTLGAVSVTFRFGAAVSLLSERLSLRAWALLSPYFARGRVAALEVAHQQLLAGGGAGVLYALPLTSTLALVAAASIDLYANRVELLVRGRETMASDRVALAAAVGLRWSALR